MSRTIPAPAVARALQQAHALLQRGQLDQAAAACEQLLRAMPDLPDALQLLALVQKRRGEYTKAEQLMQRSVDLRPGHADYRVNLGNLRMAAGRPRDAVEAYRAALAIDPGLRLANLGLVRALLGAGENVEAEQLARRLIERQPRDAEAWKELGVALRALGRLEESEAAYRRSLELKPDYTVARHNLGALLSQQRRPEEALEQLDAAAAAGLKARELHVNRARALTELTRFEEAERALGVALAMAPADEQAQVMLAKLRFMVGQDDFARDLRAVVAQRPGDARLQLAHASLLREAGQFEQAQEAFEAAIAAGGPHTGLLTGLALTLHESGRPEEALEPARRALQAAPEDRAASSCLQAVLLSLGRPDEAWPLIESIRERDPSNQAHVAMQATAARLLGDPAYEQLYDYERFVRPYTLEPPPGWRSIGEFNRDLLAVLAERHRFAAHPLDQSLRFGTQTARSLLTDPDPTIRAFLELLREPIADMRGRLDPVPDHPLLGRNQGESVLVGCWSVRLRRGGYHVNHVHPEGWLSSAYYVYTPADVTDRDAQSGWLKFGEPRFPVPGAPPARMIQPEAGKLVLFPSYMWHGTTPITTDEPRVTIAFDVITRS
jgi:tetratricopeptide (TPR) repeat protein